MRSTNLYEYVVPISTFYQGIAMIVIATESVNSK